MKRASILTGAFVLVLAIVFMSTPSDGLARHYVYSQENPSVRNDGNPIPRFNATFVGWALTPYPTDWDDDGSFTHNVRNAIRSWESAVPQLDFYEEPDGWNYLYFGSGTCGTRGIGCIYIDRMNPELEQDANYLLWATIRLKRDRSGMTNLGKEDALRHEIGHWISLHDAYDEYNQNPCSTIYSVMNAVYTTGENCIGAHAPTQRDINAVTTYWNGDRASSVVLSERPNDVLKLTWKDGFWAESNNTVMLYYWDSDNARFVLAEEAHHRARIGFHKDSINRTITREWDLRTKGWPTDTWYFAGVKGHHYPWRSHGPTTWSNIVTLD